MLLLLLLLLLDKPACDLHDHGKPRWRLDARADEPSSITYW